MSAEKRSSDLRAEKRILHISMAGSIAFLVAECIMAIITHSRAVLADCVYDLVDLAMLGPFLILVPLLYKPVTERRPYGFAQVESLLIIIKSGILIFLDVQIIISSTRLIMAGGHVVDAGTVAIFEFIVSATCIIMYFLLNRLNRKFSSPTVKAELYIWKLDAISTLGVGLAFVVQLILSRTALSWLVPYVDPAIAIIMIILLLKEPLEMFIGSARNLILFAPKKEVVDEVRAVAEKAMEGCAFQVNFVDVIKTGRKIWADIYIVQSEDMMKVEDLKKVREEIIGELKASYDNIHVELIPELENM